MSDKDISQMDFKELRNEVQMLRDELAIMQRKYEDILYNLDDENFSSHLIKEKDGIKAEIKVTAEQISSKVSSAEVESMISQTAGRIYSKIEDVEGDYSEISQSVDEISSKVSDENGIFSLFEQTTGGFLLDGSRIFTTAYITLADDTGVAQCNFFVSDEGEDGKQPKIRLWQTGGGYPLVLGVDGEDVYLSRGAGAAPVEEEHKVATRGWVQKNCTAKFG